MASAVASKGAPLAGLLRKLLVAPSGPSAVAYYALRPASLAGARRLFYSRGSPLSRNHDDDNMSSDSADACDFSGGPAEVVDQLGAPRKVVLPLPQEGAAAVPRTGPGWWLAMDDEEEVLLKVAMPDLGKEHVKVWADQNVLMIKGERQKVAGEDLYDGSVVRYSRRIELPADAFKMDQVRAEMNNGLLKVTVPKLRFHVAVD
ncbi:hypothetical protein PR202_gb17480 [Eleusine coracana subsp. coracana]|uniref:SHSP domain-containing protein n=1 Tax=Eleusine coracana subsp. coracana TaxID=191504 RepID=A0AAV5F2W7_ELECO|nr:hypothetical protein QOZ80_6BG0465780 [Eleusine coracana subsp. coracana]GJN29270.1 hypothetical protein PR202_gb17480 [Eleusine coracana subsp. coracana]